MTELYIDSRSLTELPIYKAAYSAHIHVPKAYHKTNLQAENLIAQDHCMQGL